ncbi:MAG: DUF3306 domain-containing protein [Hyphomicrobiales bacterium]
MSTRDNPDNLLSRWSRRKQDVAREEATQDAATDLEQENALEPETEEEALALLRENDPELAEKIAATDISKLTYEDDFTIFMSKKVPELIRRRALSQLWLSDPVLANVDGLNDYDEDFKTAAELSKGITSSWEPGRGYARPEEEDIEIADDDTIVQDLDDELAENIDEDEGDEETSPLEEEPALAETEDPSENSDVDTEPREKA